MVYAEAGLDRATKIRELHNTINCCFWPAFLTSLTSLVSKHMAFLVSVRAGIVIVYLNFHSIGSVVAAP